MTVLSGWSLHQAKILLVFIQIRKSNSREKCIRMKILKSHCSETQQRSGWSNSTKTWPVLQPHLSNRLSPQRQMRMCWPSVSDCVLLTSYSSLPPASLSTDPWQQNSVAPWDSTTVLATQVHWRQLPIPPLVCAQWTWAPCFGITCVFCLPAKHKLKHCYCHYRQHL